MRFVILTILSAGLFAQPAEPSLSQQAEEIAKFSNQLMRERLISQVDYNNLKAKVDRFTAAVRALPIGDEWRHDDELMHAMIGDLYILERKIINQAAVIAAIQNASELSRKADQAMTASMQDRQPISAETYEEVSQEIDNARDAAINLLYSQSIPDTQPVLQVIRKVMAQYGRFSERFWGQKPMPLLPVLQLVE